MTTTANATNRTASENKEIVRRQWEAMARHDLDGVLASFADELVNHAAIPEAQGAAGLRRILEKLLLAFPDLKYRCEDLVAEGDRVVCRTSMTGTNTGPITFLRVPMPASGRRFETEQIHVFRLAGGKVVESWAGRDDIGMMRQLGYLPLAETPAVASAG